MRKLIFPVMAAAALVTVAASSASAARSPSAGGESTAACRGGTLLTAISTHRLPAGATAYTYKLTDGSSFENIAPPAHFNDATASSTLLKELNMPPRPAGAAAMKAWAAQVAPFATSHISRSETFCEMPATPEPEAAATGQRIGDAEPLGSVGHSGSTSFSGYELRSGPYHRAVGHFVQPSTGGTFDRLMSSWIGLNSNAGSAGRLVQAGAGNELYGGGSPFWELYCSGGSADGCNGPVLDQNVFAAPGDTVSINVAYNGLTAYFQVAINGALDINATDAMKSGSETGGVADFWTERTAGDNIPPSSNIVWSAGRTYASYSSSTSVAFGSQNYYSTEMTTDGNFYTSSGCANTHILMYPASITSGGFTNYYCRST